MNVSGCFGASFSGTVTDFPCLAELLRCLSYAVYRTSWPCGLSSSFFSHHIPRTAVLVPGADLSLRLSLCPACNTLYAEGQSSFPSLDTPSAPSPQQPCVHGRPTYCTNGVIPRFVITARASFAVFTVLPSLAAVCNPL
ncbi:hypothetical protein MRX96_037954 [Rhipicephalus microplus]